MTTTQKSNSTKYFEPSAAPEEVLKQQQSSRRKIIMRFENEEAVRLFTQKTGIHLVRNKLNKISFPIDNVLDIE